MLECLFKVVHLSDWFFPMVETRELKEEMIDRVLTWRYQNRRVLDADLRKRNSFGALRSPRKKQALSFQPIEPDRLDGTYLLLSEL